MARRPVPERYPISQNFRQNLTQYNVGAAHGAIDYAVPTGTPVIAPEDGTVTFADWCWGLPGGPNDWTARDFQIKPAVGDTRTGGGIMVRLTNSAGSRWWKAHLNRTDLNPGDRVRKGQVIGYSGNTGSSTGPHLHMALLPPNPVWTNGFFGGIDPQPYLTEPYATTTAVTPQATPAPTRTGVGAAAGAVLNFVDVSEWNTVEHVRKVATDALVVRTGWGVGGDDKLATQHFATARARGLRFGTYHYAYLGINDPRAEARYYASVIPADAEFACLDYEHGITKPSDVEPAKVAAFADEFRKHSTKRLDLYTWSWVAELINPAPFGGRLWLPDFGTNPVVKAYAAAVTVPTVKGWTVTANQYGDRFQPPTGGQFDINKHLGGMWPISAAIDDTLKELGIMSQTDFNKYMDAYLDRKAGADRVGRAVVDFRFSDNGKGPTGSKQFIHLGQVLSEYREQKSVQDLILTALTPSKLQDVIREAAPGSNITADELAAALLRQIVNPNQEN